VPAPVRVVTVRDYARLLDAGAVPIDVRRPQDFVERHVAGSRSVPFERFRLGPDVEWIVLGHPVLLICDDILRLRDSLHELERAHIPVAGVLSGSSERWKARGLDVVGWRRIAPRHLGALQPAPRILDVREPFESPDPAWPPGERWPLSRWLVGEAPGPLPSEPVLLLGPRPRQVAMAVALFRHGLRDIWYGAAEIPKAVADRDAAAFAAR
jgi:rhodanese-related sulfurtransferase